MTDLFREIEQDLRREQAKELWEKYGIYLVGLAAAIVLITAVTVGWKAYERSVTDKASAQYQKLVDASATQDSATAAAAFDKFAVDAPRGYEVLARLRQAAQLAGAGDTDAAVAIYDEVGQNSKASETMRGLGRIKAGLLLLDTASYEDIKTRMAPLDTSDSKWRANAWEIIGMSAYKAGQYADADARFAAIVADNQASPGLRDRAHVMQALIAPHLPRKEDKTSATAAPPPADTKAK